MAGASQFPPVVNLIRPVLTQHTSVSGDNPHQLRHNLPLHGQLLTTAEQQAASVISKVSLYYHNPQHQLQCLQLQ